MVQSTALFVFVTCKNDLLFVKFISFVSHMNGRLLILSLWAAFQIVWASWLPNVRISWIHPHSQRVRRNLCTMHVQSITNSENNTKIKHVRLTFSQILLFPTLCLSHQKIYTHCQLQNPISICVDNKYQRVQCNLCGQSVQWIRHAKTTIYGTFLLRAGCLCAQIATIHQI